MAGARSSCRRARESLITTSRASNHQFIVTNVNARRPGITNPMRRAWLLLNRGPWLVAAARIIAIVTLGAGGGHQVDSMTVTTGCAAMVYACAAFTTVGGFRVRKVK